MVIDNIGLKKIEIDTLGVDASACLDSIQLVI